MKKNNINKNTNKGEIVIYQISKKEIGLKVRLEEGTIWLNLNQIADLFNADKSGISRHIKNIYQSKELERGSTVAKIATVQVEGDREIKRDIEYYNLDAVLSIGYRVNSKRATLFRIWATKILKNYLIRGYVTNQKYLLETREKFRELQNTIVFLENKAKKKQLKGQEGEILSLLAGYSKTLSILEQYDKGELKKSRGRKAIFILEYQDCKKIIRQLKDELVQKKEASSLFGNETSGEFEGIVRNLYQTFDGKKLYKTIEEQTAHLLYFTIKDHCFTDGNKRIASFLFVYFLDKNNYLYRGTGERKINDNALIALALLIAESDPKEKDMLIKVIISLLRD
jgi:death-on-curing family protein